MKIYDFAKVRVVTVHQVMINTRETFGYVTRLHEKTEEKAQHTQVCEHFDEVFRAMLAIDGTFVVRSVNLIYAFV